ncbi:GNAT family N-acetyltransferase [Shewanella sp. GXUN23E]|uniref:GNAT family N-acetyltransferase n=1 Tax=Shewanella sp. GXUN23E TaxID=3422498 RepID=UPI003D7CC0AE
MILAELSHAPQHIPTLARWHFNEWHLLYPGRTLDDFQADLQACLTDASVPVTWVLLDGDRAVGSASILRHDMTTNQQLSPWLANVYICPEYRGRGLGNQLITGVMQRAYKRGIERLYLFTEDQQAFYRRLGWRLLKQDVYEGAEVAIMSINLVAEVTA